MKRIFILSFLLTVITIYKSELKASDTTYFFQQNFDSLTEGGDLPDEWQEEGTLTWSIQRGGNKISLVPNIMDRRPQTDHTYMSPSQGLNATFAYLSNEDTAILITPPIDLSLSSKPQLSFWHAQATRNFGGKKWDELKVYYKTCLACSWNFLREYKDSTPEFEYEQALINLPDTKSSTFYLGFSAYSFLGHGVCLDDIEVFDAGAFPKRITETKFNQVNSGIMATGSTDNPLIRIDFTVVGNTDSLILDSMTIKSLNTNDDDIEKIKLYKTIDKTFANPVQIGTYAAFTGGYAKFSGINHELETGNNYLWVTIDIDTNALQGNTIDVSFEANSIKISDTLIPGTNSSPSGSGYVSEVFYYDGFETSTDWTLIGEFEIDAPQGKGGNFNDLDFPDPSSAFNGSKILGTDLTGSTTINGNPNEFKWEYDDSLSNNEYQAISKTFDFTYYNQIQILYYKWLNVNTTDRAWIEYSTNSGTTWNTIWYTPSFNYDNKWYLQTHNVANNISKKDSVKIRFSIGPTVNYSSGWNIDNFMIVANLIEKDVSVESWDFPSSGCIESDWDSSSVTVKIKNWAVDTTDVIPVMYQFSGKINKTVIDTFYAKIAPGEDSVFTFSEKVDLSQPYYYNSSQIFVKTLLEGDEDTTNNKLSKELKVFPTLTLPYEQDFEDGENIWWLSKNKSGFASWERDEPSNYFWMDMDTAASGTWAVGTYYSGDYYKKDSSFFESPCFNFKNTENPIFEFKHWSMITDSDDGFNLQYSTDNGSSWHVLDTHDFSFSWNWHQGDTVPAIHNYGWSDSTNKYVTAKQILPENLKAEKVKFRFLFQSDNDDERNEGVSIDDIAIYEAPLDAGVEDVIAPTDACELGFNEKIKVVIKNYHIDTIKAGNTLYVGFIIQDTAKTIKAADTITISKNIPVNDTVHLTTTKGFDFYLAGAHYVTAYTYSDVYENIYSDLPYNNDTAKKTINVLKPYVELGEDINTVFPDTVVLNGYAGPSNTYEWKKIGSGSVISTDTTYDVLLEGIYHIYVKNSLSLCEARDTVGINKVIADLGASALIEPISDCELGDTVAVKVKITNYGTDIITPTNNNRLAVGLIFDTTFLLRDTILINDTLNPDSSYIYTFASRLNMTDVKQYSFLAYTDYNINPLPLDDSLHNDTMSLTAFVNVWGYPIFDLLPDDTIHIGTRFRLNAGMGASGYTYSWDNDRDTIISTDSTYLVQYSGTGYYTAGVTDIHNCTTFDTSMVRLVIQDVGLMHLVNPVNTCGEIKGDTVIVIVKNLGTDTLATGTKIPVAYQIKGTTQKQDTITLTQRFFPGDSIQYSWKDSFNLEIADTHSIHAFTYYHRDSVSSNNALKINDPADTLFIVYPLPSISLGNDTTVTTSDKYQLSIPSGYVSYSWQNGSTGNSYLITADTVAPGKTITCHVLVTDSNTCQKSDTAIVTLDFKDVTLSEVVSPDSLCNTSKGSLEVLITYLGTDSLVNDTLTISYKLNNMEAVSEKLYMSQRQPIGYQDTIHFTFSGDVDFTKDSINIADVFATLKNDVKTINDTLSNISSDTVIWVYPLPIVTLGTDVVVTSSASYTLTANSGYSYLWSDGSTNQQFIVTVDKVNPGVLNYNYFSVTATDNHGCTERDTIKVTFNIFDIELTQLKMNDSVCADYSKTLKVVVTNKGTKTLTTNNLTLSYSIDGSSSVSESFNFSMPANNYNQADTFTFTSKPDILTSGTKNFVMIANLQDNDVQETNDTLKTSKYFRAKPEVIWQTSSSSIETYLPYTLGLGKTYNSYRWNDNSTGSTLYVTSAGTYTVTVTDQYNCVNNGSISIVQLSINDQDVTGEMITVYPVPVNNYLHLSLTLNSISDITIEISDISSVTHLQRNFKNCLSIDETFDLTGLMSGTYFIRAITRNGIFTRTIIKE